jgi:hypothetical protein
MRYLRALFPCIAGLCLATLPLSRSVAELPPSVYEAKQKAATDFVEIEVLRADVTPGESGAKEIQVLALVNKVMRSTSGLNPGDMINITYTVTERPAGFVGPGEIPVLTERQTTPAYLNKTDTASTYTPAAGVMSFKDF